MSHPTALSVIDTPPDDRSPGGWLRWSAASILGVMTLIGGLLVWRRMAGALGQPLSPATLATCAMLLAGIVLAARWLWWRDAGRLSRAPLDRLMTWGPSLVLLTIAAAVSVQGTSALGLAVLWATIVLEEGVAWLGRRSNGPRPRQVVSGSGGGRGDADEPRVPASPTGVSAEAAVEILPGGTLVEPARPRMVPAEQALLDDQVTQQFVRYESAKGCDVFSGWLRVAMPAGSRATSVHVAFCPPFVRAPVVEVEQEGGPPGRIQPVQVLPYGARLDLKLSQATDRQAVVLLRFSATEPERD